MRHSPMDKPGEGAKRRRRASPPGNRAVAELGLTVCASVAPTASEGGGGAHVYACPTVRGWAPAAWRADCLGLEFGARAELPSGGVLVYLGKVAEGGGGGAGNDPFLAPRANGPPRGGNLYARLSEEGAQRRLRWERVGFRGGGAFLEAGAAPPEAGTRASEHAGGHRFELRPPPGAQTPSEGLVAEAAAWVYRRAAAKAAETALRVQPRDWPTGLSALWLVRFGTEAACRQASPGSSYGEAAKGYWTHTEPLSGGAGAEDGWLAYVSGGHWRTGGQPSAPANGPPRGGPFEDFCGEHPTLVCDFPCPPPL